MVYVAIVRPFAFFERHRQPGTPWRSCLRHCTTSLKVAGSIPNGPSGRPRPLTGMSIRYISLGVKAAGAYRRQPYHLHVPTVLRSGRRTSWNLQGPCRDCFTFTFGCNVCIFRKTRCNLFLAWPEIARCYL